MHLSKRENYDFLNLQLQKVTAKKCHKNSKFLLVVESAPPSLEFFCRSNFETSVSPLGKKVLTWYALPLQT